MDRNLRTYVLHQITLRNDQSRCRACAADNNVGYRLRARFGCCRSSQAIIVWTAAV